MAATGGMNSRPTLLMLPGNMCDARLRKRGQGVGLFIISLDQEFLLRGARQLAGTNHG